MSVLKPGPSYLLNSDHDRLCCSPGPVYPGCARPGGGGRPRGPGGRPRPRGGASVGMRGP